MIRMTLSAATGRRRTLFSPSRDRNGTRKRTAIPTAGPTNIRNVSVYGGRSENTENRGREEKSGRGLVSISVGSGGPFGPAGPNTAAQNRSAINRQPAKTRSLPIALGTHGTPPPPGPLGLPPEGGAPPAPTRGGIRLSPGPGREPQMHADQRDDQTGNDE